MSKEVQLGMIEFIKSKISSLKAEGKFHGLLLITHSEFLVENLGYDIFLNMEGLTFDQWKNRVPVAVNPKDLSNWCHKLYLAIENRINEKKAKRV